LGEGIVGAELVAAATTDPAGAALSFAWTKNGAPIDGADSERYTPRVTDVGTSIGVTVTAAAEGYSAASSDSRTVVIAAADPAQPGTVTPEPGAAKPSVNPSDAGGAGGGTLARTGFDASWMLALGVGGLAFGVALIAAGRRRSSPVE
jgi:hypothetical protein